MRSEITRSELVHQARDLQSRIERLVQIREAARLRREAREYMAKMAIAGVAVVLAILRLP